MENVINTFGMMLAAGWVTLLAVEVTRGIRARMLAERIVARVCGN